MNKYQALYEFYNSFRRLDTLQDLVDDPDITEIMINGSSDIFIEKNGRLFPSDRTFSSSEKLQDIIQQIVVNAITEKLYNALSGGKKLKCDTGYIVLYRGRPFAQNRPSGDKTVKAKYINISADYITK